MPADGQARELLVGVSGAAFGDQATDIVDDIRAQLRQRPAAWPKPAPDRRHGRRRRLRIRQQKGRNSTEFYTVILIVVLLLLVFRALLAPLVTLMPAGLALAISQPVIAESTKIGVQVSFITQILLIVLILGRWHRLWPVPGLPGARGTAARPEPKEAVVKALSQVGESITFSAATVIAALLSLMLATFGLYNGLGPALAIALGIMLLVALTFLPALLAILGRAVFWPTKTRQRENQDRALGPRGRPGHKKTGSDAHSRRADIRRLSLGIIGYKTTGFGNQAPPPAAIPQRARKLSPRISRPPTTIPTC